MSTCNFRIYTGAFATISDPLRYEIYKASAPLAVVDSQTFAAPHPARTVNFLGLARVNYIFRLIQETSGGDVPIIPDYNFTPDNDELFYYAPVEIEADVTTGFTSSTSTFTFDGTAGTFDWRGREIYTERVGQGTMQKAVQYTWDSTTGVFTLLQPFDEFQQGELFNIEFDPMLRNSSSPPAAESFSDILIVTGATTLTADDIGKKIIIKGATPYFVVTLPEGATVPEKIVTYFEWGTGSHINVKLETFPGDTIDWGKGTLDHITGGVCESISLFWEASIGEWRVHNADGNFLKLGRVITTDGSESTTEYNVQALDGSNMDVTEYVRLYEDYVQKLPPAQVVNYSDWAANPTKYSYSNGTNFRVPDRRNYYNRNSDGAVLPGVFQDQSIKSTGLTLTLPLVQHTASASPRGVTDGPLGGSGTTDVAITLGTGTETRPVTVVVKQFILI